MELSTQVLTLLVGGPWFNVQCGEAHSEGPKRQGV